MSYDICVMLWLVAKTENRNLLIPKIEVCIERYKVGDQVLLNAESLRTNVLFVVFKTKLHLH